MNIVIGNQFKNEQDRLEEWLLYYRELGIKDFILVNDHSTDNSVEIIKSIKDVNVNILNSQTNPLQFYNGNNTDKYRGNLQLAYNIILNFTRIHNYCLKHYGKNTALGFFDVDEFIFTNTPDLVTNVIKKLIHENPVLSIYSLEVNSEKFDLNSWVTLQTTESMSIENRLKSTRAGVVKSFQNLNFVEIIDFFNDYEPYDVGIPIHWGATKIPRDFPDTELLAFLHYRKPIYDPIINIPLCDKEYLKVKEISLSIKK
jgi:hypothetical protein